MDSQRNKWSRQALSAGLCCAGLALIGALAGSAAVRAGLADGSPIPAPHTVLADGSGNIPPTPDPH